MSTVRPLVEIERRVQDRAKDEGLDLARADGVERLHRLVELEVASWQDDARRGSRSPLSEPADLAVRATRNLAGYGPLEPLLADDDVWEVMINAPDAIFVKRHEGPSGFHHEDFHDDEHLIRVLTKVLDDAAGAHRKFDPAEGLQDAQLTTGARLHIVHGDVARGGHTMVNIRKFTGVNVRSFDELITRGAIDTIAADVLAACVRAGQTIVIAGAPGSGKTTLLSCCAAELDPRLRVVVAEEVFEADLPLQNVAQMQTRAARPDRPEIDLRRLVAGFLRMAPDVAIVGEVRDREALPLLLTLSSGVQGFTTLHASSARQALSRLRLLASLATTDVPFTALTTLVAESVDVVAHMIRTPDGPRLASVVAVEDATGAGTTFTTTDILIRPHPQEPLRWSGDLPVRLSAALAEHGEDLRRALGTGR